MRLKTCSNHPKYPFPAILAAIVAMLAIVTAANRPANAGVNGVEAARVIARLLASPDIKTESGFTARLLVAPGELYDPLQMVPYEHGVLVNDDGGEVGEHGGSLDVISAQGKVSALVRPNRMVPDVGMDIAPHGFGSFAGQIFLLTQPRAGTKGLFANHLIQHVDPKDLHLRVLCVLPAAGKAGHGLAGGGSALRFGPPGSPFAGRLFAVTTFNHMIYQATPDGKCSPFADFANLGTPLDLTFTPDGRTMLVSVTPANAAGEPDASGHRGMIMKVSPGGTVDPKPMVWGLSLPGGMAFAPTGFGKYGGKLFFSDLGGFQTPVPMTQALNADGRIFRLSSGGVPKLVASGLINPLHISFIAGKLWVSDINGDFIGGRRELPDGFIAVIGAPPAE